MAEINVQRKRNNLWWLWLLIMLIIAGVIYYLYITNYADYRVLNNAPQLQDRVFSQLAI